MVGGTEIEKVFNALKCSKCCDSKKYHKIFEFRFFENLAVLVSHLKNQMLKK